MTLKQRAKRKAPGLTPRAILEKFKSIQMIDIHVPTTDGRNLILPRTTQSGKDIQLLLHQLGWILPEQPPPRLEDRGAAPLIRNRRKEAFLAPNEERRVNYLVNTLNPRTSV